MDHDPDSGRFFSAGGDGYLVSWNWPASTDGKLLATMPEPAYALRFIAGKLYWGSSSGKLYVIGAGKTQPELALDLHTKGIFDICAIDDNIATVGGDGVMNLISSNGLLIDRRQISRQSLRKILVTGNSVWVAGSDHLIRELDRSNFDQRRQLSAHSNSVFDLLMHRGALYSAGRDARILRWNVKAHEDEPNASVDAHWFTIHSLASQPGGDLLLSASMDKTIRIWDPELTLLREINQARDEGHGNAVNKVLWIDPNHFISCSDDRAIMLFHVAS